MVRAICILALDLAGKYLCSGRFDSIGNQLTVDSYMMDCPVQWDVVMEIFGVLLGLVNNDGRHEALPISSGKYK